MAGPGNTDHHRSDCLGFLQTPSTAAGSPGSLWLPETELRPSGRRHNEAGSVGGVAMLCCECPAMLRTPARVVPAPPQEGFGQETGRDSGAPAWVGI